jgi:uncharacterized membrane protein
LVLVAVEGAMKQNLPEKRIRDIFYIGVILKGIDGVIETIAGFALIFISHAQLGAIVSFLTREELLEDPRDAIANYLTDTFHNFSGASQHFSALYLLVHGVVKMVLVVGLLRNRLWAYPAAIAVFTALGLYQAYYVVLDRSLLLTALTILDVVIILLTRHEYRYRKQHHAE